MKMHPRRRAHEYGLPDASYLPSAITYDGEGSGDHKRDYALVLQAIAANVWESPDGRGGEGPSFRKAIGIIRDNCYAIRLADLDLDGAPPDSEVGAARRAALAEIIGVDPEALRVTPEVRERFRSFLRQNHPRGSAGLVGPEWYA